MRVGGTVVGLRSDDAGRLDEVCAAAGWEPVAAGEIGFQPDLSISWGAEQSASRPIGQVRHGERVVVRSRRDERLRAALVTWVEDLVAGPGDELRLPGWVTIVVPGGARLVAPRALLGDTAALERALPDRTRFLDRPWAAVTADSFPTAVVWRTLDPDADADRGAADGVVEFAAQRARRARDLVAILAGGRAAERLVAAESLAALPQALVSAQATVAEARRALAPVINPSAPTG